MRVSRTVVPVPATASTHALVAVAIPDRCVRKLSRVRSAPSSSRSGARIRRTAPPAATRSPSAHNGSAAPDGTPAASRTARVTGRPATTPGSRAMMSATARVLGGAVAAEVRSGPYRKSSLSAPRTARSVSAGSIPAASSRAATDGCSVIRRPRCLIRRRWPAAAALRARAAPYGVPADASQPERPAAGGSHGSPPGPGRPR